MQRIYVIIATAFNRTDLLLERSLLSVYCQEHIASHGVKVLVVDDYEPMLGGHSLQYAKIVEGIKKLRLLLALGEDAFETMVLPNSRTKGHSGTGAWNTGIFYAHKMDHDSYVSLLDDDDEYLPCHLADCLDVVSKNPQVLGVFQKMHWQNDDGTIMELPLCEKLLEPRQFFIGNPGVQGSNMFFRTSALVEIGAFNEAYPNTTDRDLMIRFLRFVNTHTHPQQMLAVIEKLGVIHYNHSQEKVNNDLPLKQIGLDLFYQEYRSQFSEDDYQKSIARAKKFFQYKPVDER